MKYGKGAKLKIKSLKDIRDTLDEDGEVGSLCWSLYMEEYCGTTFKVDGFYSARIRGEWTTIGYLYEGYVFVDEWVSLVDTLPEDLFVL